VNPADIRRVHLQPAYVLHHRPYRDSSRILELFTRDFGRVSVFARGARGARKSGASLISMLQPFNRLLLSWSGRGEAGQLSGAEFDGAVTGLPPQRLVSGFYLNELLMKLFARHDGHAEAFAFYGEAIESLKSAADALRPLRLFEKRLLDALGYGLALERDALTGQPIEPEAMYYYRIEQGAVRALASVAVAGAADVARPSGYDRPQTWDDPSRPPEDPQSSPEYDAKPPDSGLPQPWDLLSHERGMLYSGAMLLSLAREDLREPQDCAAARRLLRAMLDRCLEGRELKSRQVMMALRRGN